MKHGFILNEEENSRACSGSTHHVAGNSSCNLLLGSFCWVFWDSRGPVVDHCMEKGTTVASVNYCNMPRNQLRWAVCTKRRGGLSQGVVLLHKSAWLRMAHQTINTKNWIGNFSSTLPTAQTWLLTISICLDLLRNALRSCQFADDEVKEAVRNWLSNQSKKLFSVASRSLQVAGLTYPKETRLNWKVMF